MLAAPARVAGALRRLVGKQFPGADGNEAAPGAFFCELSPEPMSSPMRATLLYLGFLICFAPNLAAQQLPTGLVARFPFDDTVTDFQGNSNNTFESVNAPTFGCGIDGSAVELRGNNSVLRIPDGASTNNLNIEFDTEDFSLSFYFKPSGVANGNQYLVSKRDTNCNNLQYFNIRYTPRSRTLSATLRQNNQEATIATAISNSGCWQHVVLQRMGTVVSLYLNGERVGRRETSSRIDIDNTGQFTIGSSNCPEAGDANFVGFIDELQIYQLGLDESEIERLYLRPDRIANETRRIFLGQSIDIEVNRNPSCETMATWSPTQGVSDPLALEPIITPTDAGAQTYQLSIEDDQSSCVAMDEITFQVIDPDSLSCDRVYLPQAFTPNGIGPVDNETFGISNPFAIPELLSFEIFDRYGAQVFRSEDAFARWDGSFRGSPVNPGVMVWRVVYRCEEQERTQSGTVMVLR